VPELPEVETIRQDLIEQVKGKTIFGVRALVPDTLKNISIEAFAAKVGKSHIIEIGRRAKILLFHLSSGYTILVHLKMTGQLIYTLSTKPLEKWTRVIFDLGEGGELRFRDMRRFGYIKLVRTEEISNQPDFLEFGPEPLTADFTLDVFERLLMSRSRGEIKPLLMNQNFIAGIGNLYADEILHYARVRPIRIAATLTEEEIAKIYKGIRTILPAAIKLRGSSVNMYVDLEGRQGGYVPHLQVYRREGQPCYRRDGGTIERIKLGGRSAHFCPVCQR
jgi:formamidopyrimidine-DNA glycosylase